MAPRTRLNGRVSRRRCVALGSVPLEHLQEIKQAYGTRINSVVLAACAGALRRYLKARGETPQRPLVAAVPVALGERAADGMGNSLSAMLVELPVHRSGPVERLRSIHASSARAREQHVGLASELAGWADRVPPALLSGASRLYSGLGLSQWHPPLQNVIISNVPGPQKPLYCAGSQVLACHPFGPVYDGCALNLTVMSYDGRVGIGAIACPESVPDVETIPRAFESCAAELLELAGRPRAARPPRRKPRQPR